MKTSFLMLFSFLLAGRALAMDGMVWDVSGRCFRVPGGGSCGLLWHVDSRSYSGEAAAAVAAKPVAKDTGGRLDAQMAKEQQQVDSLRKNENVEKVREALEPAAAQASGGSPQAQK